jgi:tRNA 2-thiouridine synthesizing protein E
MNAADDSNQADGTKPEFPFAPDAWEQGDAEKIAADEGIEMSPDHWLMLRCLQEYFAKHEESELKIRELKDALDEAFHQKGGIKYLHRLFPGGPIAQGCRLAGLPVPAGAVDKSFGSVQ